MLESGGNVKTGWLEIWLEIDCPESGTQKATRTQNLKEHPTPRLTAPSGGVYYLPVIKRQSLRNYIGYSAT